MHRVLSVVPCIAADPAITPPLQLRGDIRALSCKKDFTYAAVGHDIVACKRVHRSVGGSGATHRMHFTIHMGPLLHALHMRGAVLDVPYQGNVCALYVYGLSSL